MKNSNHTPTPWAIWPYDGNQIAIGPAQGGGVAVCDVVNVTGQGLSTMASREQGEANAALIVQAVNSYQALVDALKECRSYLDLKIAGFRQDYPEDHCMVQTPIRLQATVDAALTLAAK